MAIIEKKGNLEMIKKIIDYYLNYVVEMNFDLISKIFKYIFHKFFNFSEGSQKIKLNRNKLRHEF
jgi:hypothetical protein